MLEETYNSKSEVGFRIEIQDVLFGENPVVTLEQPAIPSLHTNLIRISLLSFVLLAGCPPDNTPLIEENEQLKERIVKQESMMTTLQEGNRVLQEQIDRLNQELRANEDKFGKQLELAQQTGQGLSTEKQNLLQHVAAITNKNRKLQTETQKLRKQLEVAQQTGQGLSTEKQDLVQRIAALTKENQKLRTDGQKFKNDAQWLRTLRDRFRQSLQANNQTVKAQTLFHKMPDVIKAALRALTNNGYTLMAKMETDQKSVFITERKTYVSPSIELTGYRNQYLMEFEAQPDNQTALKVKAQYEEMTPGGTIIQAGEDEVAIIERRLIQAIRQILDPPEQGAPAKEIHAPPVDDTEAS